MNLSWQFLSPRKAEWTALDTTPDGRFVAATVRCPSRPTDRPAVVRCAQSSATAMGVHALEEVARKLGATHQWTVPLAHGDYQMLVVPEPPVLDAEMEQSLRWSIASMIEFPMDKASVGWMRIPTAEQQPLREKQVYAIAARMTIIDEHTELFEKAKLPLKAVDIRETALRNLCTLVERKGEGVGLLTVGAAGVSSTFTFKGELYLDRFIGQPMDEIYSGDEQRQQKFFDRVASQVVQSLELMSRTLSFIPVRRIVIAPLPAPLGLAQYLSTKLSVPVESMDLSTVFDLSATPELSKAADQARYLVALGAALRGARGSQ